MRLSSNNYELTIHANICKFVCVCALLLLPLLFSLFCAFLKLVSKLNYTALCCSCCAGQNFAFCSTVFTCFVVLINQFSNTESE